MKTTRTNRCLFYNPRQFPTRKELAALYLYFDGIDVVPPAQTIFSTHFIGDVDTGLDIIADLYHEATRFESLVKELRKQHFVRTYSTERMSLLGSITVEMWKHLISTGHARVGDTNALLEAHDSIVSSVFPAAGRDIVLSNVIGSLPFSKRAAMSQAAFTSLLPALPSVVSDDFDVLQDFKGEFSGAISSFKAMLRTEIAKFDFGAEISSDVRSAEMAEFTATVARQIDDLKMSLRKKITEITEKRSELIYKIALTSLAGLALGLVSNPAVGAITTLAGAHHFAQEWETLRRAEESEMSHAETGAAGLFIKFDELEEMK